MLPAVIAVLGLGLGLLVILDRRQPARAPDAVGRQLGAGPAPRLCGTHRARLRSPPSLSPPRRTGRRHPPPAARAVRADVAAGVGAAGFDA